MVHRLIRLSVVLRNAAIFGVTLICLCCCQSEVRAQLACDCTSTSDCAAGACGCAGCDAFFQSMPSSVPYESAAPSADDGVGPYEGAPAPVVDAPVMDDLAGTGVAQIPSGGSLPTGSFASTYGAVSGGQGIPSMIGDFFGAGFAAGPSFPGLGNNATIAIAGGDRQFKLAENNSPFPQDRVFFNYHHFHNAVVDPASDSQNLDRYTFGLEKTFWNGLASFEVRTPFAGTVTSTVGGNSRDFDETEFGNISLAIKGLLYREACFAASAGLGIVLPTGDDFVVEDLAEFENGTVRLQPFFGLYHAPSSRIFTQFFTQVDFGAGKSDVQIAGQFDELELQTLLMLDYSVGYWLMRNPGAKYVRAVAPMVELHYTTSLEDQDYGVFSGSGIFNEIPNRDVLNITGGLFMRIGDLSSLKIGAAAPLRDGDDKLFDAEIGLQFVRNY